MKDFKFDFEVENKKYILVFNLNVMEAIQEEYGSIQKWGELTDGTNGEPNLKAIIFGFTEMINEGIEIENDETEKDRKLLTKKQVGRLIAEIGLENATNKLNEAIVESTKSEEKN